MNGFCFSDMEVSCYVAAKVSFRNGGNLLWQDNTFVLEMELFSFTKEGC